MNLAPPGWYSKKEVQSYTLPRNTVQASSLVLCFLISAIVTQRCRLIIGLWLIQCIILRPSPTAIFFRTLPGAMLSLSPVAPTGTLPASLEASAMVMSPPRPDPLVEGKTQPPPRSRHTAADISVGAARKRMPCTTASSSSDRPLRRRAIAKYFSASILRCPDPNFDDPTDRRGDATRDVRPVLYPRCLLVSYEIARVAL
mmetsp:Transcript_18448/g.29431  ORF Transcript_18448/g.29431 Transcript_18448/m.29431 type:complete len:200 (+) Transcript_18448:293-892(+)